MKRLKCVHFYETPEGILMHIYLTRKDGSPASSIAQEVEHLSIEDLVVMRNTISKYITKSQKAAKKEKQANEQLRRISTDCSTQKIREGLDSQTGDASAGGPSTDQATTSLDPVPQS